MRSRHEKDKKKRADATNKPSKYTALVLKEVGQ
jgi:hypothetical protein